MDPRDWVKTVTGFDEPELIEKIKKGELDFLADAGEFMVLELNNLPIPAKKQTKFTILTRPNNVDVSFLQTSLASEKNVMFQVASNFNCQENSSDQTNLFSGKYLTGLMTDKTQGPSAAAGAGAAAILRLSLHWHQPINLLNGLKGLEGSDVKVNNGKIISIRSIKKEQIKIGLAINATAIFDRSKLNECQLIAPKKRKKIDQVFVSTVCLKPKEKNKWVPTFLLAAYEGTYRAAALRETKKLVLTLVGAGAFSNPIETVVEIMAFCHVNFSGDLEEVILPIWDNKIDLDFLVKTLVKAGLARELIRIKG